MKQTMTRSSVYAAIESERLYQARRWGNRQADGTFAENSHTIHAYVLFMEDYLQEVRRILSHEAEPGCWPKAMDMLRKVITLGVAAAEEHGIPMRDPNAPVVNGRDGQPA